MGAQPSLNTEDMELGVRSESEGEVTLAVCLNPNALPQDCVFLEDHGLRGEDPCLSLQLQNLQKELSVWYVCVWGGSKGKTQLGGWPTLHSSGVSNFGTPTLRQQT